MAKKNEETHETHDTNGNGGGETSTPTDRFSNWKKIQTDRAVYSGQHGEGGSVCGHLLGILDMPPKFGKAWQAFVLRLTEPCIAKREDKRVTVPAGEEVLIPFNHQLGRELSRAATNLQAIAEVKLTPTGKRKTPAGEMTTWDIMVNPQLVRRSPADRLLAMQSQGSSRGAQGVGDGVAEADAEIPF